MTHSPQQASISQAEVDRIASEIFDKFDEDAAMGGVIAHHNSFRHEGALPPRAIESIQSQLLKLRWQTAIHCDRGDRGPFVIFIGDLIVDK